MDSNLLKTKSIEQLLGDVEHGGKALRRSLTAWDLTLLGIGGIIGTGIFVLTGTAAANQAGPAITLSYLAAGLAWFYGRRKSPLAVPVEQRNRPAAVAVGDFVTMLRLLALFNGLCLTVLAYVTEFGITTEVTAKWNEIGVTPERADVVGLWILIGGVVLNRVGRLVSRSASTPARG